ncbi:titin homolog [Palaemon carinicauda]|uniref:titin homolog n=1 Tax=Palaemon carinicauda TaxID=392227 RepID=UPI0035B5ADB9
MENHESNDDDLLDSSTSRKLHEDLRNNTNDSIDDTDIYFELGTYPADGGGTDVPQVSLCENNTKAVEIGDAIHNNDIPNEKNEKGGKCHNTNDERKDSSTEQKGNPDQMNVDNCVSKKKTENSKSNNTDVRYVTRCAKRTILKEKNSAAGEEKLQGKEHLSAKCVEKEQHTARKHIKNAHKEERKIARPKNNDIEFVLSRLMEIHEYKAVDNKTNSEKVAIEKTKTPENENVTAKSDNDNLQITTNDRKASRTRKEDGNNSCDVNSRDRRKSSDANMTEEDGSTTRISRRTKTSKEGNKTVVRVSPRIQAMQALKLKIHQQQSQSSSSKNTSKDISNNTALPSKAICISDKDQAKASNITIKSQPDTKVLSESFQAINKLLGNIMETPCVKLPVAGNAKTSLELESVQDSSKPDSKALKNKLELMHEKPVSSTSRAMSPRKNLFAEPQPLRRSPRKQMKNTQSLDLYEDFLITRNEEKKEKALSAKQSEIAAIQAKLDEALARCKALDEDNKTILTNMSSLWKTAMAQLQEKCRIINHLQREKEGIIFRRAMRQVPRDELDRIISRIAAYNNEEIASFLESFGKENPECNCGATLTKPVESKMTAKKIKESVMGSKVNDLTESQARLLQLSLGKQGEKISTSVNTGKFKSPKTPKIKGKEGHFVRYSPRKCKSSRGNSIYEFRKGKSKHKLCRASLERRFSKSVEKPCSKRVRTRTDYENFERHSREDADRKKNRADNENSDRVSRETLDWRKSRTDFENLDKHSRDDADTRNRYISTRQGRREEEYSGESSYTKSRNDHSDRQTRKGERDFPSGVKDRIKDLHESASVEHSSHSTNRSKDDREFSETVKKSQTRQYDGYENKNDASIRDQRVLEDKESLIRNSRQLESQRGTNQRDPRLNNLRVSHQEALEASLAETNVLCQSLYGQRMLKKLEMEKKLKSPEECLNVSNITSISANKTLSKSEVHVTKQDCNQRESNEKEVESHSQNKKIPCAYTPNDQKTDQFVNGKQTTNASYDDKGNFREDSELKTADRAAENGCNTVIERVVRSKSSYKMNQEKDYGLEGRKWECNNASSETRGKNSSNKETELCLRREDLSMNQEKDYGLEGRKWECKSASSETRGKNSSNKETELCLRREDLSMNQEKDYGLEGRKWECKSASSETRGKNSSNKETELCLRQEDLSMNQEKDYGLEGRKWECNSASSETRGKNSSNKETELCLRREDLSMNQEKDYGLEGRKWECNSASSETRDKNSSNKETELCLRQEDLSNVARDFIPAEVAHKADKQPLKNSFDKSCRSNDKVFNQIIPENENSTRLLNNVCPSEERSASPPESQRRDDFKLTKFVTHKSKSVVLPEDLSKAYEFQTTCSEIEGTVDNDTPFQSNRDRMSQITVGEMGHVHICSNKQTGITSNDDSSCMENLFRGGEFDQSNLVYRESCSGENPVNSLNVHNESMDSAPSGVNITPDLLSPNEDPGEIEVVCEVIVNKDTLSKLSKSRKKRINPVINAQEVTGKSSREMTVFQIQEEEKTLNQAFMETVLDTIQIITRDEDAQNDWVDIETLSDEESSDYLKTRTTKVSERNENLVEGGAMFSGSVECDLTTREKNTESLCEIENNTVEHCQTNNREAMDGERPTYALECPQAMQMQASEVTDREKLCTVREISGSKAIDINAHLNEGNEVLDIEKLKQIIDYSKEFYLDPANKQNHRISDERNISQRKLNDNNYQKMLPESTVKDTSIGKGYSRTRNQTGSSAETRGFKEMTVSKETTNEYINMPGDHCNILETSTSSEVIKGPVNLADNVNEQVAILSKITELEKENEDHERQKLVDRTTSIPTAKNVVERDTQSTEKEGQSRHLRTGERKSTSPDLDSTAQSRMKSFPDVSKTSVSADARGKYKNDSGNEAVSLSKTKEAKEKIASHDKESIDQDESKLHCGSSKTIPDNMDHSDSEDDRRYTDMFNEMKASSTFPEINIMKLPRIKKLSKTSIDEQKMQKESQSPLICGEKIYREKNPRNINNSHKRGFSPPKTRRSPVKPSEPQNLKRCSLRENPRSQPSRSPSPVNSGPQIGSHGQANRKLSPLRNSDKGRSSNSNPERLLPSRRSKGSQLSQKDEQQGRIKPKGRNKRGRNPRPNEKRRPISPSPERPRTRSNVRSTESEQHEKSRKRRRSPSPRRNDTSTSAKGHERTNDTDRPTKRKKMNGKVSYREIFGSDDELEDSPKQRLHRRSTLQQSNRRKMSQRLRSGEERHSPQDEFKCLEENKKKTLKREDKGKVEYLDEIEKKSDIAGKLTSKVLPVDRKLLQSKLHHLIQGEHGGEKEEGELYEEDEKEEGELYEEDEKGEREPYEEDEKEGELEEEEEKEEGELEEEKEEGELEEEEEKEEGELEEEEESDEELKKKLSKLSKKVRNTKADNTRHNHRSEKVRHTESTKNKQSHSLEKVRSTESTKNKQSHSLEKVRSTESTKNKQSHSLEKVRSTESIKNKQSHSIEKVKGTESIKNKQSHSIEKVKSTEATSNKQSHRLINNSRDHGNQDDALKSITKDDDCEKSSSNSWDAGNSNSKIKEGQSNIHITNHQISTLELETKAVNQQHQLSKTEISVQKTSPSAKDMLITDEVECVKKSQGAHSKSKPLKNLMEEDTTFYPNDLYQTKVPDCIPNQINSTNSRTSGSDDTIDMIMKKHNESWPQDIVDSSDDSEMSLLQFIDDKPDGEGEEKIKSIVNKDQVGELCNPAEATSINENCTNEFFRVFDTGSSSKAKVDNHVSRECPETLVEDSHGSELSREFTEENNFTERERYVKDVSRLEFDLQLSNSLTPPGDVNDGIIFQEKEDNELNTRTQRLGVNKKNEIHISSHTETVIETEDKATELNNHVKNSGNLCQDKEVTGDNVDEAVIRNIPDTFVDNSEGSGILEQSGHINLQHLHDEIQGNILRLVEGSHGISQMPLCEESEGSLVSPSKVTEANLTPMPSPLTDEDSDSSDTRSSCSGCSKCGNEDSDSSSSDSSSSSANSNSNIGGGADGNLDHELQIPYPHIHHTEKSLDKSSRRTPVKSSHQSSHKSPRKTPCKTPRKTPCKKTNKTPAKSSPSVSGSEKDSRHIDASDTESNKSTPAELNTISISDYNEGIKDTSDNFNKKSYAYIEHRDTKVSQENVENAQSTSTRSLSSESAQVTYSDLPVSSQPVTFKNRVGKKTNRPNLGVNSNASLIKVVYDDNSDWSRPVTPAKEVETSFQKRKLSPTNSVEMEGPVGKRIKVTSSNLPEGKNESFSSSLNSSGKEKKCTEISHTDSRLKDEKVIQIKRKNVRRQLNLGFSTCDSSRVMVTAVQSTSPQKSKAVGSPKKDKCKEHD